MAVSDIWGLIASMLIAVFGSAVMLLSLSNRRRITGLYIMREIMAASFIGSIVFLLIRYNHVTDMYITLIAAGVSGLIGSKTISFIIDSVRAIGYLAVRKRE